MTAYRIERCRSERCRADIIWARTSPGNRLMPVDAAEVPDGLVELTPSTHPVDPTPTAVVHGGDQLTITTGTRHHSHFATCPDAAAFRGART